MNNNCSVRSRIALAGAAVCLLLTTGVLRAGIDAQAAADILQQTGVKGGLVVHLGCGDGKLTAALRAGPQFLAHGLDTDAANVEKARAHIRSLGLYGPASVERLAGNRLPYAENLVNLVVAEDLSGVSMDEVLRVLVPNGVAYIRQGDVWKKTVKPRPDNMDEWTHFLHDASGNAVSHDTGVGPPRRLQWMGGQPWARHHEHLASLSALVSSDGRIFSIEDEGPAAFVYLPPRWFLVARDAFNGIVLWKREIASWVSHTWGFRSGPVQITRRLVAMDDHVFVTLGYNEPVSCLDAATGKILKAYKATERTREMICSNGMLILAVGKSDSDGPWFTGGDSKPDRGPAHAIMALNAGTGSVAWKKEAAEYFRLSLAAREGRVCFKDGQALICVELESGGEQWRATMDTPPKFKGKDLLETSSLAPTLVMYQDVVLYGDGVKVAGLSAKDGTKLWDAPCSVGFSSPPDVLVAGGLVWLSTDPVHTSPYGEGRDPRTGAVKRTLKRKQVGLTGNVCSHARCFRNKATDTYLLIGGEGGVQFHSVEDNVFTRDDWIRGECQYGVMPANGLLYAPPHPCACFIEGKLNGFYAAAPAGGADTPDPAAARLERGPAYAAVRPTAVPAAADDWPTYRHDPARTGAAASVVPAKLRQTWKRDLGGPLGSVVVAEGGVYVAAADQHTVHALDAGTGMIKWSRAVGARVDSPPTIHNGLALFGCADGWVCCLRASDGELAWRFRAAPRDRMVVANGRLESAWPVHGSILVDKGVACVAAGRTIYLDGGIWLCKLDAETGKLLKQERLLGADPKTGEPIVKKWQQAVLSDILSSDGTGVFMRQAKLNADDLKQIDPTDHLFSTAGFLDDTWAQRTFWLVGGPIGSRVGFSWQGAAEQVPHARMLVMDSSTIYGFSRTVFSQSVSRKPDHHLWALDRSKVVPSAKDPKKRGGKQTLPWRWSRESPIQVRAMTLADDVLFVAGPKGDYRDPDSFEGKKGSAVIAVSATDGKTLAECELDAPPVWDGMAAAGARLYIALKNGTVVCMGQ